MTMSLSFIIVTLSVVFYCSADGGALSKELDENGLDNIFIINGREVEILDYPFMISILYKGNLRCGGTIINNIWVLTAAHCVVEESGQKLNPNDLEVISGDSDINMGRSTRVIKIVSESGFRYGGFSNDIAMIQLSTPLVFDDKTWAVNLPQPYQESELDSHVTVLGWGYSRDNCQDDRLRAATLNLIDQNECNSLYSSIGMPPIRTTELCADGDSHHCSGDSGGPLLVASSSGYVQVGVVSFSHKSSTDHKYPGVFTKVSYYLSFINGVIGADEDIIKNEQQENGFDNKLIIDGNDADIETYPFTVGILYNDQFTCGGSIVNEKWVLTAAHCLFDPEGQERDPSSFKVSSGNTDVYNGKETDVSSIIVHPSFRYGTTFSYDIALLELSSALSFDSTTQPIVFPSPYQDTSTGTEVTVLGWGYTESGGEPSQNLKDAVIQIFDQDECNSMYTPLGKPIKPSELCAKAPEGSSGQCTGDSGGPLVMQDSGVFIQVGVVSFSHKPCGNPNYPGVYSKVSYYVDFIQSNTA